MIRDPDGRRAGRLRCHAAAADKVDRERAELRGLFDGNPGLALAAIELLKLPAPELAAELGAAHPDVVDLFARPASLAVLDLIS